MGELTSRGNFTKSDSSEPADVTVYNDNQDQIHTEAFRVPYITTLPTTANTWPGKQALQLNTDPLLFLPQNRYAKDPSNWRIGNVGTWLAYTPVTAGMTIGNGSVRGRYAYMGTLLYVEILFLFGSTSAFTGPSFGTPPGFVAKVPPETTPLRNALGYWTARCGAGPNLYKGRVMRRNSGAGLDIDPRTHSSPSLILNATRPDTWQNGNKLHMQLMMEADRV